MEIKQFVGFQLNNEHFAIDIMAVEEIIRPLAVTPIPRSPEYVKGIVNIRDKVMPIVCLRQKMNLSVIEETPDSRIIIVSIKDNPIGFIVDKIDSVLRIAIDDIDIAPGRTHLHQSYVEGVAKVDNEMVILLDVMNLFTYHEFEEFAKIADKKN